ncbi:isopenicillin N synthase family dioxygenase [uncultured Amnibacterium sp.]|uniref:isopenicillin N synthase family dioxygenase n=1 Tax=uncultured Amnibacterium sp. TaxID=1631851 RepID=UPI0035CA8449
MADGAATVHTAVPTAVPTATTVPTIDIDRDPAVVGREIDDTLRSVGFFQIVQHGVPDDVADACWDAAAAFFDLPVEQKLAVEREEGGLYGYFPMRSASLAASRGVLTPGDLKESFNMGPTAPPSHPFADADEAALFAPNRWPAALPGMRPAWEAYFAAMQSLCARLMSIFALGLDLPADAFAEAIDGGAGALRAINYPEQRTAPEADQLRAGAHTDYGTLTVLRQQVGRSGLQVFDERTEAWLDVPAVPGALVINIGDLMARWTNDRWTSTLHRVVDGGTGAGAGSGVSTRRQSMPFFHNASYSAPIEALPTCIPAGTQPRYEPVLAGPHLAAKSRRSVVAPA